MKDDNKLIVPKNNNVKKLEKTGKIVVSELRTIIKKSNINLKIIGCVLGLILVILLGSMLFKDKDVDYPVIYNSSENELYLMDTKDKKMEDAVKLAKNESINNVLYANETNKYVLFEKDGNLYLYDSSKKDATTKIIDNVTFYTFSDDDKFIIALDNQANLMVYNYKETTKIESDVSEIIKIFEDKIIFEKEDKVYIRSINPKKDNRKKITENYNFYLKFNGKKIIYINKDKELVTYDVKKKKEEVIGKDVSGYYCDTEECDTLFYIENTDQKSIYYYDGKNSESVAKDVYAINATSVEDKMVVYSVVKDGEYTLYYQKVGSEAVKIEDKLTTIRTVKIFEGKDIYYINGKNEIKYVKIKGNKLSDVSKIGEDVTGYLYLYKDGYAYVADVDKSANGTLFLVKNGKTKKIDTDVNNNLITVSKDGKDIYYLKNYKTSGDLYVTSGGKGKKITDDVYTFEYIKDKLIYYIKDYNIGQSKGDLYRYTGKNTKIAEDVTKIANSPVYYK